MATINFLGAELDSTKEYELMKNDGLGFNITVVYTPESWRAERGLPTAKFHNCTEFHWSFNHSEDVTTKESAFESDIHATGCTRKNSEIQSVVVEYATEVNNCYMV